MTPTEQEMFYSLTKPLNIEWLSADWPGAIETTASIVKVDFQRRTITLPGGKFDLDNFLRIAKDVCIRLS